MLRKGVSIRPVSPERKEFLLQEYSDSIGTYGTHSIPSFSYRGFNVPALNFASPPSFTYEAKTKGDVVLMSSPLSWRAGLYAVGRDLALGVKAAQNLPESVKRAGKLVYLEAHVEMEVCDSGQEYIHNDAVLIVPRSEAPKGMLRMREPWMLTRFFTEIDGFKKEGGKIDIIPSPETRDQYVWLPANGYAVPTRDGWQHPVGTPFETVKSRETAIKNLVDRAGLNPDEAHNEIMRFERGSTHHKLNKFFIVNSSSGRIDGPIGIGTWMRPEWCYDGEYSWFAPRKGDRKANKEKYRRL